MRELLQANILFLTPILILSIGALMIIMERTLFFFSIRVRAGSEIKEAIPLIGRQPVEKIKGYLHPKDKSPEIKLLERAITARQRRIPRIYKIMLEALKDRYGDLLERNLNSLPTIANVATLMGLFGTVSGMITVFSRMKEAGVADPYILAGGISRALVTTAAGLAVAIPVLLAHYILGAVVDRHVSQMEEIVTESVSAFGVLYERSRELSKA